MWIIFPPKTQVPHNPDGLRFNVSGQLIGGFLIEGLLVLKPSEKFNINIVQIYML